MKNNNWNDSELQINSPKINNSVYDELPEFLKDVCSLFIEDREKDTILLGSLGVLSSCFPMVKGMYDRKTVGPNLFIFVAASASAGKGILSFARMLGDGIQLLLKEEYAQAVKEYQQHLKDSDNNETDFDKPVKPILKKVFIPSNSSSASLLSSIQSNGDIGVLFESEADTLVSVLKKEWGNFSDVLRRVFHHEPIESQRKKDDEYISIQNPHLSVVLSGTPNQMINLIGGIENGFFSRFIFYCLPSKNEWRDVFDDSVVNTDLKFRQLGDEVCNFYQKLRRQESLWKETHQQNVIVFKLTNGQREIFNDWFKGKQDELYNIYGSDFLASVRRLAIITFRIAMILTITRLMRNDSEISQNIVCSEDDFHLAVNIIDTLFFHTAIVYDFFTKNDTGKTLKNKKRVYFESLPDHFTRKMADNVAVNIGLNLKTAEKYLSDFKADGYLIHSHNDYQKVLES